MIDNIQEDDVVWDYFDRQISPPRYTYAYGKQVQVTGTILLHLLPTGAVCSAVLPEAAVRRSPTVIRSYGRV